MLGFFDIGYQGYAGFELCHPLPVVNGQTVGLDFVDKNAQLAAEYMRGILAEAKTYEATCIHWRALSTIGARCPTVSNCGICASS
jgi:hypothetical protein